MKKIAFFNNKGGVGKTTLACNLANYFAEDKKLNILVVDLDPQCNSTQLILSPEKCAEIYWDEQNAGTPPQIDTIYKAVRPLEEGDGEADPIQPIPRKNNRFNVDLIPGHPRISAFEDKLGPSFRDATAGDVSGLRMTIWLKQLLAPFEDKYDIAILDVGPSLGALNRSILASSDYFITPMGADIFSVVALRNISEWLSAWIDLYQEGVQLCIKRNPGAIERHRIPEKLDISKGFLGFTVQQYSTVTIRGKRRATVAYDQIINKIPETAEEYLFDFTKSDINFSDLKLGDIPHLRSLVPLAQSASAPLARLQSNDGLTGGQYSQQKNYIALIENVGNKLLENIGEK